MKKHILFAGRQSGKFAYAKRVMEEFMDKNPDARVCLVSINGVEFFENAEFVEVTNLLESPDVSAKKTE